MFFVAEFDDNTVEVAPSNWVSLKENASEGHCFYPPKTKKSRKKLVKGRATPEKDWKLHAIRLLGKFGKKFLN